jgi:hypothetical protein
VTDYQKATCWLLAAFFLFAAAAIGEGGLAYTPAVLTAIVGALYFVRAFFREDSSGSR